MPCAISPFCLYTSTDIFVQPYTACDVAIAPGAMAHEDGVGMRSPKKGDAPNPGCPVKNDVVGVDTRRPLTTAKSTRSKPKIME